MNHQVHICLHKGYTSSLGFQKGQLLRVSNTRHLVQQARKGCNEL